MHVFPPVWSRVEAEGHSCPEKLPKVRVPRVLRGVVDGLSDVAREALVVWAQPDLVSLHQTHLEEQTRGGKEGG